MTLSLSRPPLNAPSLVFFYYTTMNAKRSKWSDEGGDGRQRQRCCDSLNEAVSNFKFRDEKVVKFNDSCWKIH